MTTIPRPWRTRRTYGPLTPLTLIRRAGRVVLWATVIILLARGVNQVLADPPALTPANTRPAVPGWPDDEARAFAAQFATAYLAGDARTLERLATPDVQQLVAAARTGRERARTVQGALPAGTRLIGSDRALITVAATVTPAGGRARTVRLVVPVTRDDRDGLAVTEPPAFAAPPPIGAGQEQEGEPVPLAEAPALTDVLTRYFRAYLAGDPGALRYLTPPGTMVRAAGGLELVRVGQVTLIPGRARDGARVALVPVIARDPRARDQHQLRYRARVVKRDRWYVTELIVPEGEPDA